MTFPSNSESVAQDRLRTFFDRIERLHEERSAIGDDIKEVFAEAKAEGWDAKVMKIVLQKRRMDHSERLEQEALVDLYMQALGMVPEDGTPIATRAPAQQTAGHTADQGGEGEAPDPALPATSSSQANANTGNATNSSASAEREPKDGTSEGTVGRESQVGEAGVADAPAPNRVMHMTPLEPREAGGLKGFGFTVSFEDRKPERPEGCLHPTACAGTWRSRCNTCQRAFAVEAGGTAIPHNGAVA